MDREDGEDELTTCTPSRLDKIQENPDDGGAGTTSAGDLSSI